jgi:transcription factor IIIB subunit 2
VASRLRLPTHFVDAAHRLFTIAVEKNFVQGRRTTHVVAACLYIACRQEKSQHMLIDFSDALQVNVYTLGTCFLKFRRLLGLKLEIIDPALYVYRFAAHLELDDKANAVALTALRLVARMKRDWIVAGRRPAGICAAALLIAARAHGFDRHCTDVTRILRVCGLTVQTRLKEFEQTASSSLTLDQFHAVDLEQESDPPRFTQNKLREARARAIQEGNVALLTSGALDVPTKGRKWKESKKLNERKVKFKQMYNNLEKELDGTSKEDSDGKGTSEQEGDSSSAEKASGEGGELVLFEGAGKTPGGFEHPKTSSGKDVILPNHATVEEQQPSAAPVEAKITLAGWKEDMPDSVSKEIDGFFRSEEEEKQKEAIFNKINKDYIEQQERKESERLSAEASARDQEADELAQAEGRARYERTRGKRGAAAVAATTEEQLLQAVSSRKVSRKINYDALSSIFDEDGSFATDVADDNATADDASEMMYEMI